MRSKVQIGPISSGYHRSLLSSHPLPHPAARGTVTSSRISPCNTSGCFCHGKEFFLACPFNEMVFPSSFLAFHPALPSQSHAPFPPQWHQTCGINPAAGQRGTEIGGEMVSSRYYFKAGFPAAMTGCCSAQHSQSPTLKSEETPPVDTSPV